MSSPLKKPNIDHQYDKVGWVKQLEMTGDEAVEFFRPTFNWLIGNVNNWAENGIFDKEKASSDPFRNGEDYVANWEEAFLFHGFTNGEYSFLTTHIMHHIDKYGFVSTATYHWPEKRNPKYGNNEIIVRLQLRGQECITDVDKKGDKIIQGVTNPRDYLPDEVVRLFDEEFGQA